MLSKYYSYLSRVESQKINIRNFVFTVGFLLMGFVSNAQCAMCRAALQSGGDSAQAEAVNDGIVYLMIIPYVLVGVVCIAIYQIRRKKKSVA